MKHKFMKYCPEHYKEIKNYDLAKVDNFKGWVCHHINGEKYSQEYLMQNNLYWNRSDPNEFIFVTISEHNILHGRNGNLSAEANGMYGKHHSDETKDKLRKWNTGRKHTPETIAKMRESAKRRWQADKYSKGVNYENTNMERSQS